METLGIETEKDIVPVNGFMETSAPNVFAIGDIVPSQQLAHVGSAEGILAVEKIAGLDVTPMNYEHMPSCTYSSPEVGSVDCPRRRPRNEDTTSRSAAFRSAPTARPASWRSEKVS